MGFHVWAPAQEGYTVFGELYQSEAAVITGRPVF